MNLVLRELGEQDEAAFLRGLERWHPEDVYAFSSVWAQTMSHAEHLKLLEDKKDRTKIPSSRVPTTVLYGFVDGEIVGRLSVRHELNDELLRRGGHIGYVISPSMRGNGFANEMMRQSLLFCKNLGLEKVLVTCNDANVPSWKVIERNRGSLEDRRNDEKSGELYRRYWIDVNEALNPTRPIKEKVVGYIVRLRDGATELLVFDHDKVHSEAGTQVPAGTVSANEDLEAALLREIQEEAGIGNLLMKRKIDQYQFFREIHQCFNKRHVFLLEPTTELPEAWTHKVTGDGIDAHLNFHYCWINLEAAKDRLAARLGDSIILL